MYRPKRRRVTYAGKRRMSGRGAYYYKPNGAFNAYASSRLRGRGSYLGDLWKKYRKYVPRVVGAGLGAFIPGAAGIRGGWDAGANVSKMMGWGAYRAPARGRAPRRTLRGRGAYSSDAPTSGAAAGPLLYRGTVPSMHGGAEGSILVQHKECIGIINSSTGFAVNKYEINPGLNTAFPWLSGIARNFQQYDIEGLAYVFKPTCNDGTTGSTIANMGTVTMCTDQNILTSTPVSTIAMLQTQFSVSGKPSSELLMPVEQDRRRGGQMVRHLLVRSGAVPVGGTAQFYDDAVMFIATDGNGVAGVQLGQLFVTYSIRFVNPASTRPGMDVMTARMNFGVTTSAAPFGTGLPTKHFDNIGVTTSGGNKITLDAGNDGTFLFDMWTSVDSDVEYDAPTITAISNFAVKKAFPGSGWVGSTGIPVDGCAFAPTPSSTTLSMTRHWSLTLEIQDPTLQSSFTVTATHAGTAGPGGCIITQLHPDAVL